MSKLIQEAQGILYRFLDVKPGRIRELLRGEPISDMI